MPTTDDPTDPILTHGVDETPVPQAEVYLVDKGEGDFVRPVRRKYIHEPRFGGCGGVTTMAQEIAETYARDPYFYGATYCTTCHMHRPVGVDGEFVWASPREGTPLGEQDRVGT